MQTIRDRLGRKWPWAMGGQGTGWWGADVTDLGIGTCVLIDLAVGVKRGSHEDGVMTDSRPTLQFELDVDAIRLLHRSVRFHLEKWPGGPDPQEQEDLHRLQTLLYAALLECSFDQDGER